jgi:hypothetical protein
LKRREAAGFRDGPVHRSRFTAWTRAFLLGDDNAANRVIPIPEKAHHAWTFDLEAFRAAGGDEKRFVGALLVARHGDFHTHLWSDFRPKPGAGGFGPDWWCSGDLEDPPGRDLPETVLSKNDRAKAAGELRHLRAAGDGQTFLAPIIMAWSKARPDDPRVPEALHRLVRITRYGCRGGSDNWSISKAAFHTAARTLPRQRVGAPDSLLVPIASTDIMISGAIALRDCFVAIFTSGLRGAER